ncbi:MAG: hypothetical protein IJS88_04035 [Alphaproteobacteria bacterium]|nr:hypothetical protein [Alphaproteobacteria bacterium]
MIKKFFHFICVLISCALWITTLIGLVQLIILLVYHTTPLVFYRSLANFWNRGNVLQGKDLIIIMIILSMIPLCFYGWYKLYHFKYMKLLTVPLNKIFNSGFEGYVAPDVNIKNLKIEEKKSLDQFIKERLDQEKKKNKSGNATDFRKEIIEKIQESNN